MERRERPGRAARLCWLLLLLVATDPAFAARDPGDASKPRTSGWTDEDRRMATRAALVDALDRIDDAMASGRYSQALELLLQLETALPGSSTLANNIGCVYAEMGQKEKALAAFRRANDLDPKSPVAAINVAIALFEINLLPEIERRLEPWKTKVSDNPAVGFLLIQLADAQGRKDEIPGLFETIASSEQATPHQIFEAGNRLRDLRKLTEAESAFRRITRIEPGMAGPWVTLIDICRSSGRESKAEAMSSDFIARFPGHPAGFFQRGMIRIQQKRWEEAAKDFDEAASRQPAMTDASLRAAGCYKRLGRIEEARKRAQAVLESRDVAFERDREMARQMLEEIGPVWHPGGSGAPVPTQGQEGR